MIEVGAVIMMILGLVSAFIGVIFTLVASSLKKPVVALHERVDKHDARIMWLEKRDAGREQEIKNILEGINHLKVMFQRHEDKG